MDEMSAESIEIPVYLPTESPRIVLGRESVTRHAVPQGLAYCDVAALAENICGDGTTKSM